MIALLIAPAIDNAIANAHPTESQASMVMRTALSFLLASRAWYNVARNTPELWGAMLSYVQPGSRTWNLFVLRARDAPLRLSYMSNWRWSELDEYINAAEAIYAGNWSPWRNWNRFLVSLQKLPNLRVAVLRPDTYNGPSGELFMPHETIISHNFNIKKLLTPDEAIPSTFRAVRASGGD